MDKEGRRRDGVGTLTRQHAHRAGRARQPGESQRCCLGMPDTACVSCPRWHSKPRHLRTSNGQDRRAVPTGKLQWRRPVGRHDTCVKQQSMFFRQPKRTPTHTHTNMDSPKARTHPHDTRSSGADGGDRAGRPPPPTQHPQHIRHGRMQPNRGSENTANGRERRIEESKPLGKTGGHPMGGVNSEPSLSVCTRVPHFFCFARTPRRRSGTTAAGVRGGCPVL